MDQACYNPNSNKRHKTTSTKSGQILNDISAQLGYAVPFTLVHAGKYRSEDKTIHKLYTIQ